MGDGGLYTKQEQEAEEFRSLCPVLIFELLSALSFASFNKRSLSTFCAGFG